MTLLRSLLLSTLVLGFAAACGSTATASSSAAATSASAATSVPGSTASLSLESELLLGTLRLEGTALAVTAEEAVQLKFLWEAVRSLSASDTTAESEMSALIEQIRSTMTPDQVQAIEEMKLTEADLRTAMQDFGPLLSTPAAGVTGGAEGNLRFSGGPPAGGESPGDPPAGGFFSGGPQGGEGLSQEQIATLQAMRQAGSSAGSRVALRLIQPVLELLTERSQER